MMRPAAAIAVALTMTVFAPAHAGFAELEWQYQCLKSPDAVCFDATPSGTDPLAPAPAASPVAESGAAAAAATPSTAAAVPTPAAPAAASATPKGKIKATKAAIHPTRGETASADPLSTIAAHLQAGKPSPVDMQALQARAATGNARALELLAWAELVGVGLPRDRVQAYFHYGKAAAAGAANGLRDQAAIYAGSLTAEERQQILLIETGNLSRDRH